MIEQKFKCAYVFNSKVLTEATVKEEEIVCIWVCSLSTEDLMRLVLSIQSPSTFHETQGALFSVAVLVHHADPYV